MSPARINYWAEGPTDRAVARRIIEVSGNEPGDDYSGRRRASPGKDYLDANLSRFNAAARYSPWLVLRDADGECAFELARRLLPVPSLRMRMRVVVPAVEAWFLADSVAFADFLGVRAGRLPDHPEHVRDVKDCIIGLVRISRFRALREDMLPVGRSGLAVGPSYATRLIDFAANCWEPDRAAERAPSLRRALDRLTELAN